MSTGPKCKPQDLDSLEGPLIHEQLCSRTQHYAHIAGASPDVIGALLDMLHSDVGRAITALTPEQLHGSYPVNDTYKPKMWLVYSELLQGVTVDFALNVRRSPFPLERMEQEDPQLFAEFKQAVGGVSELPLLPPEAVEVLQRHAGVSVPPALQQRAEQRGNAQVQWPTLPDGRMAAIASGPAEAASNTETTTTQLVQEYCIRAQARELCRTKRVCADRTERVANSLGHLAAVVTELNALEHPVQIALFAGRRSSSLSHLLLSNWFCMRHLNNCLGSSSIFAVTHLNRILQAQGLDPQARLHQLGPLAGTHAHELMSIMQHLLSHYDVQAGSEQEPVPVSSLVAHLLFLRSNGGLATATALSDTFGTQAFIAAALATEAPQEFVEDVQRLHPDGRQIAAGSKVFDVFRQWRLDSGDYAAMAEVVMSAWEGQRAAAEREGRPPPRRPALMHSNLSDVEHLRSVSSLPERIRPATVAFGGLSDGFVPFTVEENGGRRQHTLELASVVMKAVQARHPALQQQQPCAGKTGDDEQLVKLQVDPRLSEQEQETTKASFARLFKCRRVDGARASRALRQAYHFVTREHGLN